MYDTCYDAHAASACIESTLYKTPLQGNRYSNAVTTPSNKVMYADSRMKLFHLCLGQGSICSSVNACPWLCKPTIPSKTDTSVL